MPDGEQEFWYRYEDVQYAGPVDEFDRLLGPGPLRIMLRTFPVTRHTPSGVWLSNASSRYAYRPERFVLRDAKKRFACPTKKEALESFIARKKRQAGIHRARMQRAELALNAAKTGALDKDLYESTLLYAEKCCDA